MEANPLERGGLPFALLSEGIRSASQIWSYRDADEKSGGGQRHSVLNRLGTAIHRSIEEDGAISNPGHSGFSVRESDLDREDWNRISTFLNDGVKWGILEERLHTSKAAGDTRRRKYYLHSLLSPYCIIPMTRVKEPLYINSRNILEEWIFGSSPIRFRSAAVMSRRGKRSSGF
jgi:hypothetical protein